MGKPKPSHLESLSASLRQSCVRDFCDSLSADEAQLYRAGTVASTLLDEIRQASDSHGESSKSIKVSKAIMPFIEGVNQYGKAMDVLANANDLISPIWGAIRVVLHLAKSFGEYFEKLGQMLEDIGHLLIRIPRYSDLYPENSTLKLSIRDIYKAIFDFCFQARHVFRVGRSSRGLKRVTNVVSLATGLRLLWKPFQAQFGSIREQVASRVSVMEKEVDLTEKETARDERKLDDRRWAESQRVGRALERFIDDESVAKVNAWLAPVDVRRNHKAALGLRHKDTGNWFLKGEEFQSWLEGENTFLWLNGIAGAGKTVLTSCIIDHLDSHARHPDVALAYFYFDHRDPLKQQPTQLLGTLLAMLAKQHRSVFDNVQSFFLEQERLSPVFTAEFDELLNRSSFFLGGRDLRTVMIVVDGLDEARKEDWECLARALRSLHQENMHVKILVTSRDELTFKQQFEDLPSKFITEGDVSADIGAWIADEVSERVKEKRLKIRSPLLEKEVRTTLVEGAKGMFQWAKCQIDALCKPRNERDIRAALQSLPGTLQETYVRILERVPSYDVDKIRNVLCWLVRGTRDLSLVELSHAVAIDPDCEGIGSFDFDAVDTYPEDILDSLGGLVTVSKDQMISLAHFSVKEFLIGDDLRTNTKEGAFWVGKTEVDSQLARACLRYLCSDDFAEGDEYQPLTEKYPFYPYAAESWAELAHRSEVDAHQDERLVELTLHLLKSKAEERLNFELWVETIHQLKPTNKALRYRKKSSLTPLLCAASFGLTEAAKDLIEDQDKPQDTHDSETETEEGSADEEDARQAITTSFKAASSNGHAPIIQLFLTRFCPSIITTSLLTQGLYHAASQGHVASLAVLLDHGAQVDSPGGKDGTALQAACLEGKVPAVELLLDRGASHDVACKRYGTPLAAAAEKGHLFTSTLLLRRGADPNARGGWYASPLVSAIVGQNGDIVKLLIDHGADVNAYGGRHGFPLAAAASLRRDDLIKMLISRGARVNDEDDKTSDALYAACLAGHLSTVDLLLACGADVNAKGGKLRTALVAASSRGYVAVVEKLLAGGADLYVDVPTRWGNALHHAAENGHRDVVICLAKAGIDLEATGGEKGSAIAWAAGQGHDEIIETLCHRLGFCVGGGEGRTAAAADAVVAAAMGGHESTVELLVEMGARPACLGRVTASSGLTKSSTTCSPIQAAAAKGNLSLVQLFLDLGVGVNTPTDEGRFGTALMAAIDTDDRSLEIVQLLIDHGADVNQLSSPKCDAYGFPIQVAARRNDIPVVKLLLQHGADVNLQRDKLWSALQMSAMHADDTVLSLLLAHGADVNLQADQPDKIPDLDGEMYPFGPVTALQTACWYGHVAHVRRLLSLGARFATVSLDKKYYLSALQMACRRGLTDVINTLIDAGAPIDEQGLEMHTPLQAACIFGDISIVRSLLDRGASASHLDVKGGSNAISGACMSRADTDGKIAMVRLLVERGADINAKLTGPGSYNLQLPHVILSPALMGAMIDLGADVNASGGQHGTVLTLASGYGKMKAVRLLLERGADPDVTGGMWHTAMQAAFRSGYYVAISALAKAGASVNVLDRGIGRSVMGMGLGLTTKGGQQGCCDTLVEALVRELGFNVNARYGRYGFALQDAIIKRRPEPAGFILRAGADVNMVGGKLGTALTAAAFTGQMGILDKLLEKGADPRLGNKRYPNAAYGALRNNREVALDRILEVGGKDLVTAEDVVGHWGSPLSVVSLNQNYRLVTKLVDLGASINPAVPDSRVGTPLQASVSSILPWKKRIGTDVCEYLLDNGADVHARGGRWGTVLGAASLHTEVDVVEDLLEKGANANETGVTDYHTPLQAAAARGAIRIAKKLLEHGADPKVQGGRYWTALQAACVSGNMDLVELLTEKGVDVNVKGGRYTCALHAAAINGHEEIAAYLIHRANATFSLPDRRVIKRTAKTLDKADEILNRVKDSSSAWEDKLSARKRNKRSSSTASTGGSSPGGTGPKRSGWDIVANMTLYDLQRASLAFGPGASTTQDPSVSWGDVKALLAGENAGEVEEKGGAVDKAEEFGWEALSWVVPGVIGR